MLWHSEYLNSPSGYMHITEFQSLKKCRINLIHEAVGDGNSKIVTTTCMYVHMYVCGEYFKRSEKLKSDIRE
jgi:hypothetical protein